KYSSMAWRDSIPRMAGARKRQESGGWGRPSCRTSHPGSAGRHGPPVTSLAKVRGSSRRRHEGPVDPPSPVLPPFRLLVPVQRAEPAVPLLEVADGLVQVLAVEVRPVHRGEPELGVGR